MKAMHAYSDSEIARYSGISLKKARATISDLQRLGLVAELLLKDGHQGKSGKKKRKKVHAKLRQRNNNAMEKLVLALTDIEIKKPSETVRKVSADINVRHTEHGVGEATKGLIKKGLVALDDQKSKTDGLPNPIF
jgi:hypothetical protein